MAASQRLDGMGLLQLLQRRSLLQSSLLPRLLRQCPPKVALGQFLLERSVLTARQLQSLFASQTLQNTCTLLQASDVRFAFYPAYPFPYWEMTGVKIRATDIALPSLRMIKIWDALTEKLPRLDSGLTPARGQVPHYRLNSKEKWVLRLAAANHSLTEIAAAMKLPERDVQKIGFCLIFVGVANELPLIHLAKADKQTQPPAPAQVSPAFLGKLSHYLQQKSTYLR